jgi:hypothetical protein
MKTQQEIEKKRLEIDTLRRREFEIIPSNQFKRGQLAGAQQVLWWLVGLGMEPIRAILSDAEIALMKEEPTFPGLEPLEPIIEVPEQEDEQTKTDSAQAD